MQIQFGKQAFLVLLASGLFTGALAASQQPASQHQQEANPLAVNPADDESTHATPSTTVEETPDWSYSRQGMYNEYQKHWKARCHDSDFIIFLEQQPKQAAPAAAANRLGEKRDPIIYDHFAQQPSLWSNRNKSGHAWQASDAYWRLSDSYWRNPEHRQLPGYEQYGKNSAAYWVASQRYWDAFAKDRKAEEAAATDQQQKE